MLSFWTTGSPGNHRLPFFFSHREKSVEIDYENFHNENADSFSASSTERLISNEDQIF